MGLKLLSYSEKYFKHVKVTNSIVGNFNNLFEKCNFKYFYTIEFYYCVNPSLNNNYNNIHIAAVAPLPLTMHPRSWARLLTFGTNCTLPNPSLKYTCKKKD